MPEAIRFPGYSANYVSYLSTAMSTRTIAGITVPDTSLIAAALALVREKMDDWSYNHVMRSWLLGFVIANRIPGLGNRDTELHAIAALLHDLGWIDSAEFTSTDKCFEVDGANAARAFVENQPTFAQWDDRRKQLLWDAIALHTYPLVGQHKETEVKATGLGIMADFVGPQGIPGGALQESEWRAICDAFPRSGFKTGVVNTLCGFCRSKPETTYDSFVGDFGEEFVEGYSKKGKRSFDVIVNAVESD
jgi:hypothetical protein